MIKMRKNRHKRKMGKLSSKISTPISWYVFYPLSPKKYTNKKEQKIHGSTVKARWHEVVTALCDLISDIIK